MRLMTESMVERVKLAMVMEWMKWAMSSAGIKELPDKLAQDMARAAIAATLRAYLDRFADEGRVPMDNPVDRWLVAEIAALAEETK